jgi:hypothetical protein
MRIDGHIVEWLYGRFGQKLLKTPDFRLDDRTYRKEETFCVQVVLNDTFVSPKP